MATTAPSDSQARPSSPVIAAAKEMGLDVDQLCDLAGKRLEENPHWRWVMQDHLPGTIHQLDHAKRIVIHVKKVDLADGQLPCMGKTDYLSEKLGQPVVRASSA